MRSIMSRRFLVAVVLAGLAIAQRRVDPHNTFNRVICVVPITGAGTAVDPRRPQYAPWPPSPDPNGIIGYYFVPSDDGKSAVVEFVARNRAALLPILSDKSIKAFEKGRATKSDIEAAVQQSRKDFNLDTFGMVM
jgi:hypothetical protein